jgi:hypothetical protein
VDTRSCLPYATLPIANDHRTNLTGRMVVVHCSGSSCWYWRRPRPEPVDPAQDLGKQGARHCDLGQLEHDVAAMAHDPGADLDQFLAQRRQRPMLDLRRQRQGAQEVGEVVGQRVQLKPHRVLPKEGTEVPRFFLYNTFSGTLRFFFFNYKIDNPFSSAFVKIGLVNTGAGGATPALLTYQAGDPSLYKPWLPRPDGYQSEYLEEYDQRRGILAVTQLAFREWCYADFLLVGFDPRLAKPQYTDSAFAFEVIGVDEFELAVDGEISLAPLYKEGTSNIFTDFASLANAIPGGGIFNVVKFFANLDSAKTAAEAKADAEDKPNAKQVFLDIAGFALKTFCPGPERPLDCWAS